MPTYAGEYLLSLSREKRGQLVERLTDVSMLVGHANRFADQLPENAS